MDTSESDVRVIWLTSGAYSTADRRLSLLACRLGAGRRVRGAISWPAACWAARGPHLSHGYVPDRPGGVYGSLAAVRGSAEPGDARRGALRPGLRRSDDLGCGPGHDRHHIPGEPREQAKAIGVFSFVALFARVPVEGNYLTDVLPSTILLGIGVGTSFPALMTLAMSGATHSDAGLASGLVNTTVQVGAAVGLAVLATLSATRSEVLIENGEPAAAALTGGYQLAFWIGAGLVVVAIAVAMTVLKPERQAKEEIQAEAADCEAA